MAKKLIGYYLNLDTPDYCLAYLSGQEFLLSSYYLSLDMPTGHPLEHNGESPLVRYTINHTIQRGIYSQILSNECYFSLFFSYLGSDFLVKIFLCYLFLSQRISRDIFLLEPEDKHEYLSL